MCDYICASDAMDTRRQGIFELQWQCHPDIRCTICSLLRHDIQRIMGGDGALIQWIAPLQRTVSGIPDMQTEPAPASEEAASA